MNFDLTDDQKLLVDTARGFAKKTSPVTRFREMRASDHGFERAMWRQMGELGWLGVVFPEHAGGLGGQFIDLALILEQLATTLVPEPLLASVVAGGWPIARAGSAEQQERYLAPLIEGQAVIALALSEDATRYDVGGIRSTAERDGDGYRLSGRKRWVLCGHAADRFVVSARTGGSPGERDGVSLFVVEADAPGVTISPVATMDGQRAAMVDLDGVHVDGDALLGEPGQGAQVAEDTLDACAAGACAEAVGIAQTVLDMTVEYLKTREQFGVKIGTFQALQHRAVDMFVDTQLLRSLAVEACLRIDDDDDDERRAAVSAAKVQLSTGGRQVVRSATQLHGGIGVTEEHDVGLYFKRMQVLSALFGDELYHLQRFAAQPSYTPAVLEP